MYKYVRPLLFKMDEERANNLVVNLASTKLARTLSRNYYPKVPDLPIDLLGKQVQNPVGLSPRPRQRRSSARNLRQLRIWIYRGWNSDREKERRERETTVSGGSKRRKRLSTTWDSRVLDIRDFYLELDQTQNESLDGGRKHRGK